MSIQARPTVQIENLGQITSELWEAHAFCESEGGLVRAFRRILDRHGVTAAEYEAELQARLSPYCAYQLNPGPLHFLHPNA